MNPYEKPAIDEDRAADFEAERHEVQETVQAHAGARFCGAECRLNYREDRISGVALPTYLVEAGSVHYLDMCAELNQCAYCQERLKETVNPHMLMDAGGG